MSLPFGPKRFRAYEIEFGAGGQRLGCKFLLDDGSLLFVHESEITSEIETLMASLGSPTEGIDAGRSQHETPNVKRPWSLDLDSKKLTVEISNGVPRQKAYYADPHEIRSGESSGVWLLDRSAKLVSESRLMTPVLGDRKIYDFIPVPFFFGRQVCVLPAQKTKMGPRLTESRFYLPFFSAEVRRADAWLRASMAHRRILRPTNCVGTG
jgi:hypothetical protein